MWQKNKKAIIGGIIILLLLTIPLTVFVSQQEQENRSRAASATTLYFNPTTTAPSPLVKTIGDTFTLDVMVNPGTNKVSTIRYQIYYDTTKLSLDGNNPVTVNTTAFPANLEGPILGGGTIAGSVSIGSDYNLAITAPTKVLSIQFKATGLTNTATTSITYTALTQVLSVGASEQAAENVLSGTTPAYIRVVAVPTATPTPTPTKVPTPTTAPPTLTFNASATTLPYNGSTTLTWTSTNTTSCTASNAWTGTKSTSGSESTGQLTASKTYALTCTGPGGSVSRSVFISVGSAPTPTPTKAPTPTPTSIPTPTPTSVVNATTFSITTFMHGLGNSGDNANPTQHSLSNKNPLRKVRDVEVSVYNANDQLVLKKSGTVSYFSSVGNFQGTVDMGTTLASGVYTIKVKSPFYLNRRISGIHTITAGTSNTLPAVTLVTGDTNNDNALNILDYNMIVGCYSDFGPPISCTASQKLATDLTDDGNVNQFDYNLFLRDLSVQNGD